MRLTLKGSLIAVVGVAAASTLAYAAGNWSTLPQVGESSFCASTVSGVTLPTAQGPFGVVPGSTQGSGQGVCQHTIPAGPPALTGSEIIPADTQAANSAPPQTVTIPIALMPGGAYFYQTFVPAAPLSGLLYSFTVPNNVNIEILDPTQTVTGVTLTLPAAPLNGQILTVASTHTITTLQVTPTAGAGTLVSNAPTALTVSTTAPFNYQFMYDSVTNIWYRTQ